MFCRILVKIVWTFWSLCLAWSWQKLLSGTGSIRVCQNKKHKAAKRKLARAALKFGVDDGWWSCYSCHVLTLVVVMDLTRVWDFTCRRSFRFWPHPSSLFAMFLCHARSTRFVRSWLTSCASTTYCLHVTCDMVLMDASKWEAAKWLARGIDQTWPDSFTDATIQHDSMTLSLAGVWLGYLSRVVSQGA